MRVVVVGASAGIGRAVAQAGGASGRVRWCSPRGGPSNSTAAIDEAGGGHGDRRRRARSRRLRPLGRAGGRRARRHRHRRLRHRDLAAAPAPRLRPPTRGRRCSRPTSSACTRWSGPRSPTSSDERGGRRAVVGLGGLAASRSGAVRRRARPRSRRCCGAGATSSPRCGGRASRSGPTVPTEFGIHFDPELMVRAVRRLGAPGHEPRVDDGDDRGRRHDRRHARARSSANPGVGCDHIVLRPSARIGRYGTDQRQSRVRGEDRERDQRDEQLRRPTSSTTRSSSPRSTTRTRCTSAARRRARVPQPRPRLLRAVALRRRARRAQGPGHLLQLATASPSKAARPAKSSSSPRTRPSTSGTAGS